MHVNPTFKLEEISPNLFKELHYLHMNSESNKFFHELSKDELISLYLRIVAKNILTLKTI